MKIVIDKENIIHLFSVAIYAMLGEPYKDIKEVVTDLVEKLDYTELPKGYGRLIDAREYEKNIRNHYFDDDTVIRCTEVALSASPTIIEADREITDEDSY